jgi:phosphatidate cytidylyltransferase
MVFFIGIPAIVGLVFFLPHYGHLALNIIVIIYSAVGAIEFSIMLEKKQLRITKIEACIFGALAPVAAALTVSFNCPEWVVLLLIMAGASWVLLSRIFSSNEKMETVTGQLAAGFSVLVYPGFFMYWLVKMSVWEHSGIIIFMFLMITLGSDAAAWLAGTLFGKNNRGIIPASPNKSIAGFIGGVFGSIIVSGGTALIVPAVFIARIQSIPVLCQVIVLGIITGIAAVLGDLAESAIKRSCDCKDSGNLMLGRGGVLDSIDSIAFASPVFFLLFSLFFIA